MGVNTNNQEIHILDLNTKTTKKFISITYIKDNGIITTRGGGGY